MTQKPTICLTFDLEEFDLPLEYKHKISEEEQIRITYEGMNVLLPILEKENISSTFFTSANYAQHQPKQIQELSVLHEIASHNYFHSSFNDADFKLSKEILQNISGTEVIGFRMPRMAAVNYARLQDAGYLYDSSLNPTCIPGRYNHLTKPKTIFKSNQLIVFPATVTPVLRIPLFWLTFKNCSVNWYCAQIQKCLDVYGYVNLYFHPWEFVDISGFSLPSYISTDPKIMTSKLCYFINYFKDKAVFTTIKQKLYT